MEKKQLTDGSMALQEKQCRVITIEATEKQQDIKLLTPVSALLPMTSSTPSPLRIGTTQT